MRNVGRVVLVVGLGLCGIQRALAQGEVQRQHDADLNAFYRGVNTYHNNADDYPKPDAPPHKVDMSPNYVPVLEPPYKRKYEPNVDTPAEKRIITLRQHGETDPVALLELADCYYYGRDIAQDKSSAHMYYNAVANKLPRAAYLAAKMTFLGDGVFKNTFTAYPVMRSAAERGNPDAITFLKLNPEPKRSIGEFPSMLAYEHEQFLAAGVGVRPVTPAFAAKIIADTKGWNSPETFKKLQKKMKGQDVLGVGRALLWGVGVPVDLENAKSLLELARNLKEEGAGQDESWATVELEERKPEPALWSLWYSLENLAQSATVDYLWALAYNNAKKPTEQLTLLAASAYLGNLQARTDYAIMEWEGNGGNPDDANGFASLTLAAKTNRNAQFLLGQAYVQGLHGTPVDLPKAIQLFQASATQGQIEAEHMLAVAYHDGVTIAQDDVAALKWVQSPAQAGFPKDQRLLAQLLQGGKAVPHDAAKALEWMQKAASNGDEAARLALANGFDGK